MGWWIARRVIVGVGSALTAAAQPGVARAQPVGTVSAVPGVSTSGAQDTKSQPGFMFTAPLRLSLQASVTPMHAAFPNCISYEDPSGRPPTTLYNEVQLTPHLFLSSFSTLGACPIDGAGGGAVTYAMPVTATSALVFNAGVYGAPGQVPLYGGLSSAMLRGLRAAPSPINASARIDYFWNTKSGSPFSVGVETRGLGRQMVTFGRSF